MNQFDHTTGLFGARLMWRQPHFDKLRACCEPAEGAGCRLSRLGAARRLSIRCALLLSVALPASAGNWTATARPARLVNGAPVLFQVKPPAKLDALTGTWLGHQITFSYDTSTKTWFALAGTSIETTPGKYALALTGERSAAKPAGTLAFSRQFAVALAKYPKIRVALSVEKKFTEPTREELEQIEEGKKVKQDYLNRVTADREWAGRFTAPANAAISDVFGSQRVFNGTASSPHQGLDFRVPAGTPVAP